MKIGELVKWASPIPTWSGTAILGGPGFGIVIGTRKSTYCQLATVCWISGSTISFQEHHTTHLSIVDTSDIFNNMKEDMFVDPS